MNWVKQLCIGRKRRSFLKGEIARLHRSPRRYYYFRYTDILLECINATLTGVPEEIIKSSKRRSRVERIRGYIDGIRKYRELQFWKDIISGERKCTPGRCKGCVFYDGPFFFCCTNAMFSQEDMLIIAKDYVGKYEASEDMKNLITSIVLGGE